MCKHNPINIVEAPRYTRITVCSKCGINLKKDKRQKQSNWLKSRGKYERSQK